MSLGMFGILALSGEINATSINPSQATVYCVEQEHTKLVNSSLQRPQDCAHLHSPHTFDSTTLSTAQKLGVERSNTVDMTTQI